MNPEMSNVSVSRTPQPNPPPTITTHEKITAAFCALFCVVLFWLVMSAFAMLICLQEVQEFCPDPSFPLLVRDGSQDRAFGPRCCTMTLSACKEPTVAECDTLGLWNEWILYSLCTLGIVGGSWAMYTVIVECRRGAIAVTTEEDADRFIHENF